MAKRKKKNSQPSWWIAVGLLVLGLFSFLGKVQLPDVASLDPTSGGITSPADNPQTSPGLPPAAVPDTIKIASFNIQVFGQSKLSKPEVIDKLARIVRHFDVVAIQEIRSVDQNVIPEFLKVVNSANGDYRYLISPRLGRTVSKEQYAYLYRADRIEVIPGSVFNVEDPKDLLHREPFVAGFRTRTTQGEPFSFTLINAHTDPDEAEWEVSQLAQVYQFVASYHRHEDDIILLGDLNVDNRKLGTITRIPVVRSIVPEGPTNTRGTKQYDHILINQLATTEFTGQAGVLNMMDLFQITQEQALELSDHHPVWAEFSTIEKPNSLQMATPAGDAVIR